MLNLTNSSIKLHIPIHLTEPVFDSTVYKALPRLGLTQPLPLRPHPSREPLHDPEDKLLGSAQAQLCAYGIDWRGGTSVPKRIAWRVDREVLAAHLDELLGEELGAIERRRRDRILKTRSR